MDDVPDVRAGIAGIDPSAADGDWLSHPVTRFFQMMPLRRVGYNERIRLAQEAR